MERSNCSARASGGSECRHQIPLRLQNTFASFTNRGWAGMRHRPTKLWSHIWVIVAIVKYCSYGVHFSNAKILLRKRRFLHLIVLTVVKNGSSEAPTSSEVGDQFKVVTSDGPQQPYAGALVCKSPALCFLFNGFVSNGVMHRCFNQFLCLIRGLTPFADLVCISCSVVGVTVRQQTAANSVRRLRLLLSIDYNCRHAGTDFTRVLKAERLPFGLMTHRSRDLPSYLHRLVYYPDSQSVVFEQYIQDFTKTQQKHTDTKV
jgi:hypothetical protein